MLRGRTEHEATRCFVDKRSERVESVERHHHRHAEPRCDRHLADGNRKAALTAIVGCGDLAVADRSVDRPVTRQWVIKRGGHPSGAEIEKIRRKRAAERALVRADQPEVVTDLHASRIDRSTQVGHEAERRDQQGAGDCFTIELVEQRVLAGDERHPIGASAVGATLHGANERTEPVGLGRVAPTEVVEHGDLIGIAADGHKVAYRFVHREQCHRVRVVSANRRADAVGEHDGFAAFGAERLEYRCVGGTIGLRADIGADHGAATDLVVVAADDVLLGGHIRMREQLQHLGGGGLRGGDLARSRVGPRADEFLTWDAVVQERHRHVDHAGVAMAHHQAVISGEATEVGHLNVPCVAERLKRFELGGRHRDDDALLGLANPDLPRLQTGVLERHDR